jgi:hypothetical protein
MSNQALTALATAHECHGNAKFLSGANLSHAESMGIPIHTAHYHRKKPLFLGFFVAMFPVPLRYSKVGIPSEYSASSWRM